MVVGISLAAAIPARAQSAEDSLAVRRAAMDCLEGFYEGDTAKLVRSIRPDVFTYGYSRNREGTVSGSTSRRPCG